MGRLYEVADDIDYGRVGAVYNAREDEVLLYRAHVYCRISAT